MRPMLLLLSVALFCFTALHTTIAPIIVPDAHQAALQEAATIMQHGPPIVEWGRDNPDRCINSEQTPLMEPERWQRSPDNTPPPARDTSPPPLIGYTAQNGGLRPDTIWRHNYARYDKQTVAMKQSSSATICYG